MRKEEQLKIYNIGGEVVETKSLDLFLGAKRLFNLSRDRSIKVLNRPNSLPDKIVKPRFSCRIGDETRIIIENQEYFIRKR